MALPFNLPQLLNLTVTTELSVFPLVALVNSTSLLGVESLVTPSLMAYGSEPETLTVGREV